MINLYVRVVQFSKAAQADKDCEQCLSVKLAFSVALQNMSSPQDTEKGVSKEFQAAEPSEPLDFSSLGGDEQENPDDTDSKHPGTAIKGGEHEEKVSTEPPSPFGDSNMRPGETKETQVLCTCASTCIT